MEHMLSALRSVAVFMLAAQLMLQFFPGKKYEKYGKMMVGVLVLAQLAGPLLAFGEDSADTGFSRQLAALEEENAAFSRRMEQMDAASGDMVSDGLLKSVEERLVEETLAAGVTIGGVSLEGAVLVVEVLEGSAADSGRVAPVTVPGIEVRVRGAEGEERREEQARAAEQARESRQRALSERFAGCLGMEPQAVEVRIVG